MTLIVLRPVRKPNPDPNLEGSVLATAFPFSIAELSNVPREAVFNHRLSMLNDHIINSVRKVRLVKQDDTRDPMLGHPFNLEDPIHLAAKAYRDAVKRAFDAHFGLDSGQPLRINTAGVEAVVTARERLKWLVNKAHNHSDLIHRFAHTLVNTEKFADTKLIWRRRENELIEEVECAMIDAGIPPNQD